MLGPVIYGIMLAALVWYFTHRSGRALVPPLPDLSRVAPTRASDWVAAGIRDSDPDFDESSFLARVSQAFLAIQHARGGDLSACRAFVSDGIFEGLGAAQASLARDGRQQRIEDVVLAQLQLAHLQTREAFDELTVGIQATARTTRWGGPRALDSRRANLGAFWTFLRRRGSKSLSGPGLLESHCPNCGAPIATLSHALCTSCRSWLRSGEHDWVLCEITQPGHWAPRAASRIPGIDLIHTGDSGFSVQHLEDRVALSFWRVRVAEALGRPEVLASLCRSAPSSRFAKPSRIPVPDLEIQSIETAAFERDESQERALARVRWRAAHSRARPRCELFLLERDAGTQTHRDRGISSAHCSGCGAPETGEQAACGFCGETFNDGRHNWLLSEVVEAHSKRGQTLMRETLRNGSGRAAVPGLADLPPAMLPWALYLLSPDSPRPDPANADLARATLPRLVDLALARGGVEGHRRVVVDVLAAEAGFTEPELRRLIDRRGRDAAPV